MNHRVRNSSSYMKDKKYQRVERETAKELGSNNPALCTGDTSNITELDPVLGMGCRIGRRGRETWSREDPTRSLGVRTLCKSLGLYVQDCSLLMF